MYARVNALEVTSFSCLYCRIELSTTSHGMRVHLRYCKSYILIEVDERTQFHKLLRDLSWDEMLVLYSNRDGTLGHRLRCALKFDLVDRCESCNLSEWQGKRIPLEVNHKDGNRFNQSRENLEVICPNCHALKPYYRGVNKGKYSQDGGIGRHKGLKNP